MTFSRWHRKFGERIGKAVLSCSLLWASFAIGADYSAFARRLHDAKGDGAKSRILKELYEDESIDLELQQSLGDLLNEESYAISLEQAESMVELRAFAEHTLAEKPSKDVAAKAKEIKSNPLYRDPGDKEESNWFAKSFEKMGELIGKMIEAIFGRNTRSVASPSVGSGLLSGLLYAFIAVLVGLVLLFLYFVFRHFSWKKSLERKAKAMLSEEEPELTKDEYLVEADRLATEGKHREAVRYLYLACLLLFDENGVARFVRGQTNWEHLRRIQASENLPLDLDFQPATQKFDVVWYGMRVEGQSDVDSMRDWYVRIFDRLRRKAA